MGWFEPDERELVARAQRGDADAYAALVARYQTRMFQLGYRMLGDQGDALDLTQEALVRAFGGLAGFEAGRPLWPWLRRILVNLALSWRARAAPPELALPGDDEGGAPDPRGDPELLAIDAEQAELLREAVLALPPHYRAVVVLRHYQDLSYEEIGEALAIPLSDVKSRLFRARRQLRAALEGQA